jgi:transposase
LRKVGMSKERRVDPQVTVGLLTDSAGFPLAVHLFEGNKAETKWSVPDLIDTDLGCQVGEFPES